MDVEPLRHGCFASRRTVEYALAKQPVEAVYVQPVAQLTPDAMMTVRARMISSLSNTIRRA